MIRFRIVLPSCCLLLAIAASAIGEDDGKQGPWIQLFNGKNLDGWQAKIVGHALGDNFADTFRVEDGVLKVVYDREHYKSFDGRFGHLFYKEPFSHYRVRVEYRFVGHQLPGGPDWAFRNSGIMLHCEPPAAMEKDQAFPASIEVQLLGGKGTGQRSTANLCTPGTTVVINGKVNTRHCIDSSSKTYHGDRWVIAEAEVHGDKLVKHVVEGETVLSYEKPKLDIRDAHSRKLAETSGVVLDRGYISLQSESHPIEFRKVELLKLED